MKGCTVVSFMEEKLSIFRNIQTFYVDAALPRCLRRDWVRFFFFVFLLELCKCSHCRDRLARSIGLRPSCRRRHWRALALITPARAALSQHPQLCILVLASC